MTETQIFTYEQDLPDDFTFAGNLMAIDTETMGLNLHRDRLCLVQFSFGDGNAHLVRFEPTKYHCPNLKKLLMNPSITKIFHYARFDVACLYKFLDIMVEPIYCTKIASKLVRTYTDRHGLKDLCRELLDASISKQQQSSYWGSMALSEDQKSYAASDVLYLHGLKEKLDFMLKRENRTDLAQRCFEFLPVRVMLDLEGWPETDIFAHS